MEAVRAKVYHDFIRNATKELTTFEIYLLLYISSFSYPVDGDEIIREVKNPKLNFSSIARYLGRHESTVRKSCKKLEEKGYLILKKNGRKCDIFITKKFNGNLKSETSINRGLASDTGQKNPGKKTRVKKPGFKNPGIENRVFSPGIGENTGHFRPVLDDDTILYNKNINTRIYTHKKQKGNKKDVCVWCGGKESGEGEERLSPDDCLMLHVQLVILHQDDIDDDILWGIADNMGHYDFMLSAPGAFEAFANGKIREPGGVIKAIKEGWYKKERVNGTN